MHGAPSARHRAQKAPRLPYPFWEGGPAFFHPMSEQARRASNGPGAQGQLSLSICLVFTRRKQVPCTTHSFTVPRGGHCADRDKGTEAARQWRSHCSARGCAGLLQPQGSAQPAREVHLLPLRALDEGMVLKETRRQSGPGPQPCSGRCPWPVQWLISKAG